MWDSFVHIEPFLYCTLATFLAVIGLLCAEYKDNQSLRIFFKPIAALGFIAAALVQQPFSSAYDITVLIALILCAIGDMCLLPKGAGRGFLVGIGAFLLGHLGYIASFFMLIIHSLWILAGIVLLPCAYFIYKWLYPDIPAQLRTPVLLYVVVITVMVAISVGVYLANTQLFFLPIAAVLFWLSDISVARGRFKNSGFTNKLWGIPLYFIAQLLFALSIAFVRQYA